VCDFDQFGSKRTDTIGSGKASPLGCYCRQQWWL